MYIRTVIVQKGFSQIKYFSEMLRNTASFSLTDEWQFNGYIYHTYPGSVFMLLWRIPPFSSLAVVMTNFSCSLKVSSGN